MRRTDGLDRDSEGEATKALSHGERRTKYEK